MKRVIISVILILTVIGSLNVSFAAPIPAPEQEIEYTEEICSEYVSALEKTKQAILSGKNEVLYDTPMEATAHFKLTYMLMYFFRFKTYYDFSYKDGDKYTGFEFTLSDNSTSDKVQAVYDEFDKIFSLITPEMTDFEKALTVHDYMTMNYVYDMNYLTGELTDDSYFGIGLINNKKGVCAAYSVMYQYIMRLLKIPCETVISDSMNHEWNIVYLDGNWYHIDVTWDSSITRQMGYASHEYFLFSDSEAANRDHKEWKTYVECTDTRYDKAFWRNIGSHMICMDGYIYYSDKGVRRRKDVDGNEEILFEDEKVSNNGFEYYKGKFYFVKSNYTDYKRDDIIYAYDKETGGAEQVIFRHDKEYKLSGFYKDGNILYCSLFNSSTGRSQQIEIDLDDRNFELPRITMTAEKSGQSITETEDGIQILDSLEYSVRNTGIARKAYVYLAIHDEDRILKKVLSKDVVIKEGKSENNISFDNIDMELDDKDTASIFIFSTEYDMLPLTETYVLRYINEQKNLF